MTARAERAQGFLHTAHEALARGAWEDARRAFTDALAQQEGPEALEGLGLAAWWLDDAAAVFDARELLEGHEPIPEHGWLHAVAGDLALMIEGDTAQAHQCALDALAVARALG